MGNWLKIYGNRRVLSLVGLGFSSGLPLALTASTLQAWLISEKVDLSIVGAFSLVGLPYALKVFWAPLIDRFCPPWLGRRRGWIISLQVLLAASILALGYCAPASFPALVAFAALVTAFLSASQDIAIDAYRADVLREKELGPGAATAVVGYRSALAGLRRARADSVRSHSMAFRLHSDGRHNAYEHAFYARRPRA